MDILNYETIESEEAPFAIRLAYWIKEILNPKSVLDIGCGPGMHVRELRKLGVQAYGIDQDERVLGQPYLDQISVFDNKMSADLIICLEVAEHIDQKLENYLADCIERATENTLIWTAAAPGQGGVGHINCKPKEEWEEMFIERDLVRNHQMEKALLMYIKSGYHMGWFANNLLYLEKVSATQHP